MDMKRYVLSLPSDFFREVAVECALDDKRVGPVLRDLIIEGWKSRAQKTTKTKREKAA